MSIQTNWANQQPNTATVSPHQWHSSSNDTKVSGKSATRSVRLFVWSVVAFGLLGGLIYLLPYSPDKTPCFALVESNYAVPFPVNPWAQEDVKLLQQLDGETISLYQTPSNWESVAAGLGQFAKLLKQHADEVERRGCCIFYINAIGLVDDLGEPCIVPATANPHDVTTWIRVQQLFDVMDESLPPNAKRLVILDCARVQTDWDLGVFYNDFVESASQLLEEGNSNSIILTSSAPGEIAWPRSTFALNLAQGLAGQASDSDSTEATILASRLHQFVSSRVQSWSQTNRGENQTPQLYVGSAGDVDLTISIHQSVVQRLSDHKLSSLVSESRVKVSDVMELWKTLDQLKSTPFLRLDPIRFRNLQQELLRLEQLRSADSSLSSEAAQLYAELKTELEALSRSDWGSLSQQWANLGWDQPHFLPLSKPHSVEAAQAIGSITPVEAENLRGSISEAIREASGDEFIWPTLSDRLHGYTELQYLQISYAADTLNQWSRNKPLSVVANLRQRGMRLAAGMKGEAFGDPRVHERLRANLSEAFDAIRVCEDTLWNGEDAALVTQTNRASELLGRIVEKQVALTQAFRIADEVNNELPYLGQWLADPWLQTHAATAVIDLRNPTLSLVELSERVLQLNLLLAGSDVSEPALNEIVRYSRDVAASHQALRATLKLHAEALIDLPDVTVARWREMHALLATPLIDSETRQKLIGRYEDSKIQLLYQYEQLDEIPDAEDARTQEELQEHILSLLAWAPQVASSIASLEQDRLRVGVLASVGKPVEIAETVNQKMRRYLLDCASLARVDSASVEESIGDPDGKPRLSREQHVRSASGLWFPQSAVDLLQFEHLKRIRGQFLWMAAESLRDSWGGEWLDENGQPAKQPFFAMVADDYINAAESIAIPRPVLGSEVENLRRLLTNQRLTAMGGVSSLAKDSSPTPGLGDVRIDAKLQPMMPGIELAPGLATVFVRSRSGKRMDVQDTHPSTDRDGHPNTCRIKFPFDEDSYPLVSVSLERSKEIEGRVQLTTFFRGLEFNAPLTISTGQGTQFSYEPQEYGSARLTLFGEGRQQPSIIFVLDCSASMSDPAPSERPGVGALSKLEVAKSTLAGMLDELAREGSTRVGVIAFGHRIGWSKSSPVRLLTQPRYVLPIPDNVSASTDVESVLSLGRFDSTEAAKLAVRLDGLLPWGQSPLYLSIMEAIAAFTQDDRETDKSIVVITDGVNYQFTPSDRWSAETAPTSLTSVVDLVQESSIPVHILGFGVEKDERVEAKRAFEQIAQASDGSYRTASNGRDLLNLLKSRLGGGTYTVVGDAANRPGDELSQQQRLLNESIRLSTQRETVTPAIVQFRDATAEIDLYDGQWLQLLATNRPQIRSIPYDVNSPTTVPLVTQYGRETGYVCRVHRPVRHDASLTLSVSIQAQYEVWTRRPTEVWLEVTPICEDANSYYFYDAHFQPFEPVPVLQWTAEHWPREADRARVRFWCKNEVTQPTESVLLSEVLRSPDSYSQDTVVPGIEGVVYRMAVEEDDASRSRKTLRILEVHDVNATGMTPLRIGLANDDGVLTKVQRYFDVANGVGQHVFHLDMDARSGITGAPAAIHFSVSNAAKSGAWQLQDEFVDIEITDYDAVIPVATR
ncbi:vWA domain-containing protein [Aporhodopirellula aestuarii]|uniref:VWA domain-containing protein n=1 Tax=Aporhodopirellula aestuarii TaxID=2950107 RepID=A0ABT0TZ86_9BACT|nr:vWA domain-containing protein [Aporhodopirellula aestuarii]MCM2369867.1 VWA domain-containing protein [Aporhodopirellula aestuarii]